MPYAVVLNNRSALTASEAQDMNREFDLLRAELDDLRTKYAAVVALLVAGTAPGAGYSAGTTLGARRFTPT